MTDAQVTDADVAELVELMSEAASAYIGGKMRRYLELMQHADDFTLMDPFGGETQRHSRSPRRVSPSWRSSSRRARAPSRSSKPTRRGASRCWSWSNDSTAPRALTGRRTGRCARRWCSDARTACGTSCTGTPTHSCIPSPSIRSPSWPGETTRSEGRAGPTSPTRAVERLDDVGLGEAIDPCRVGGIDSAAGALGAVHREEHRDGLLAAAAEVDHCVARTVLLGERERDVGDHRVRIERRRDNGLVSGREQPVAETDEGRHADLGGPPTEPGDGLLGPKFLVSVGPELLFVAFLGRGERAVEFIHRSSLPDAISSPNEPRRATAQAEAPGMASSPYIITTSSP